MNARAWATIALLTLSNSFMNVAWYGHLKFREKPLLLAILASWGIALFEYCLQVPANRIGYGELSLTQLKVAQEVLSVATFAVFAMVAFKERLSYNHLLSFGCLVLAAYFATRK